MSQDNAECEGMTIEELRCGVRGLAAQFTNTKHDPIVDAYLACLEAAENIATVLDEVPPDSSRPEPPEALWEALYAVRAASSSVRFSLTQHNESTVDESHVDDEQPEEHGRAAA